MKTMNILRNVMLYSSLVMISAFTFVSCDKDDDDMDNRPYTVSGNASGSQMVPGVSGGGNASMTGTYNPNGRTLTYTTNWNNMSGAASSGGFYKGASGVNGTAVGATWTLGTTSTGSGTHAGTMTLTEDQEADLINGNWYYSMGTTMNPGGEIRGQVNATR